MARSCWLDVTTVTRAVRIELSLWLRYSIELLIEYSSTRLIPDVSINYRVSQNKRTPGSTFKFVVQQRLDMNQSNDRNALEILFY